VRLLRTLKEKKSKGCAYIEFSSDEEAIKVIEAKEVDWTPEVKINISSKSDRLAYIREKTKNHKDDKVSLKKGAETGAEDVKTEKEAEKVKDTMQPGLLIEAKIFQVTPVPMTSKPTSPNSVKLGTQISQKPMNKRP